MGLFSRRRSTGGATAAQARAITEFWTWWQQTGADEVARAIADQQPERIGNALSRRISAIDRGLGWELGPGLDGSEHALVVTPEGEPELRAVARRWRLAAPEPSPVWEYADARRATPDSLDLVLEVGGTRFDLAAATAAAHVRHAVVDVTVHHPAFPDVVEDVRRMAAVLFLDEALGENEVETWVGQISTTTEVPLDPVPLRGLGAVVRHLRDSFTDENGDPGWVLLEGSRPDGRPVLAGSQVPLKAVTAPQLDTHVAVAVPYTPDDERGLPGSADLADLRGFEDHVVERVGGSGRLVAHEMSAGTRLLHFYVDGATPAADQVRAAVGGWRHGRVRVESAYDPGWERVAHLRT